MSYSNEIKPRFKKIIDEVNMILLNSDNIKSFPFSITKVIKEQTGIVCRSFDKGAAYGVEIAAFGSDDAIIEKFNGRYIIFYNDSSTISTERKKFSLGHEFGHKIMNHNLINKENYDTYEVEANFFAAQLLMPEQVINELRKRGMQITKENLQKWFGVSKLAAKKRMETLRKIDYSRRTEDEKAMDDYIIMKFQFFIDTIAPKSKKNNIYDYDPYEDEELQRERDKWY